MQKEDYSPYSKHQIYTGGRHDEDGVMEPKSSSEWTVFRYKGDRNFSNYGKGPRALILNEPGEDNTDGFWPVISFLSRKEAIKLCWRLFIAIF